MEIHSVISEQPPFPQHPSPPPFQPQPRQQQPMVFVYEAHVWEYKVTSRPADTLMTEEELNALGKEGGSSRPQRRTPTRCSSSSSGW
jgi:hypothetical protein